MTTAGVTSGMVLDAAALDVAADVFAKRGWWASPPCLSEQLLDKLERDIDRYFAGERDHVVLRADGSPWRERSRGPLWRGNCLSLLMNGCRAFVLDPLLPAIAARLARTPEIRLLHDQVWYKEAECREDDATTIRWHDDKAFWGGCSSERLISAWIPLSDCTMAMGPLTFIDGSHRPASTVQPSAEISMTLKRGQVSFHHCRTTHGSGPNRSSARRVAFCIHYQDQANTWLRANENEPCAELFLHDLLRLATDGTPDFSDPNVCPRLWPPEAATRSRELRP